MVCKLLVEYNVVNESGTVLTQMRKGILEFCVLAVLRDKPAYGLELTKALTSRQALLSTEGTLYPLLARLRKRGLVETWWNESPDGPPRRYYALTDDGRAAVTTFESLWKPFRSDVDSILGSET